MIASIGLGIMLGILFLAALHWVIGWLTDYEHTPKHRAGEPTAVVPADDETVAEPTDIGLTDKGAAYIAESEIAYWYDEDDEMCEPMCELGRAVYAVSSMSRELEGDR